MAFFDKKQEVIDIQLTQFGKNLLSRGSFKPVYYCFFDDDITYNASAANILEKQNRSQERLKEAQRPRTQYSVTSLEETYDQLTEMIETGEAVVFNEIKRTQDIENSEKMLKYQLQNTILSSQLAPQLQIDALQCKITSSSNSTTSKGITKSIPQLNFSASYTLKRDDSQENDIEFFAVDSEYYIDLTSDEIRFLNDSKIIVEREDIILDVTELNSSHAVNQFEVEVFEIVESGTDKHLVNLDTEEKIFKYFDILVDGEINRGIRESSENRRTTERRRTE